MQLRYCISLTIIWCLLEVVVSTPQTFLLNQGSSQFNVTSFSDFSRNLNATLTELRGLLENMYFAVAQEATGSDPVYAMVQCRNYMSEKDSISCFTATSSQIRNCSSANGARVIYDGCFLSEANKLGEGGFGEVYKGILKNGRVVAVKKLAISKSERVKAEFDTEVKLIGIVHHRNLDIMKFNLTKLKRMISTFTTVLRAKFCVFLTGEGHGSLNWKQRFDIILGTAKGLAYLHEEFHACIIHRDIKPGNILLDRDFQPKIADFGLVRLLPEDQTHLSTKFAGTYGYTAPEYAIHGQLSVKVDTYSFGVVVLEIISGQKNTETSLDPTAEYLLKRAWGLYQDNMAMDIVDRNLEADEYNVEDMKRMIEIAFLCTQSSADLRPTMSEVVALLKTVSSLEPRQPTRPAFIESERRIIPEDSSPSTAR
ncbi:hypothetical protein CRYUN_Cryun31cG0118400 [Craigia yunnanensis]